MRWARDVAITGILLLAACAATFGAAGGQTPEPVREMGRLKMQSGPGDSWSSGSFTVRLTARGGEIERGGVAQIFYSGTEVWSRPCEPSTIVRLMDLNRDGWPEVVLREFTGGTHCCNRHIILELDRKEGRVSTLLDWDGKAVTLDNAEFAFLSGGQWAEIVTHDGRFAGFGGLPLARSPFPRKIFAFRDGAYVAATRDYPEWLRRFRDGVLPAIEGIAGQVRSRTEAARDTEDAVTREQMEQEVEIARMTLRGAVLEAWIYCALLDEEDSALDRPDREVKAALDWVRRQREQIRKLIAATPF
ncbi:MAG: hypothetical protein ACUVSM_08315 [Armatimonadota bacterium]